MGGWSYFTTSFNNFLQGEKVPKNLDEIKENLEEIQKILEQDAEEAEAGGRMGSYSDGFLQLFFGFSLSPTPPPRH